MKARVFNFLVTLVIVCLAGWAAWVLYQRYIQDPWTRDSQVRANIVGLLPAFPVPIIHVTVQDNQQVKMGDLLFEIDPTDFNAQLNVAAGQVLNSEANLKQRQQDLDRQSELYQKSCGCRTGFSERSGQLLGCPGSVSLRKSKSGARQIKPQLHQSLCSGERIRHQHEYQRGHLRHRRQAIDGAGGWRVRFGSPLISKKLKLPHIQIGQKANLSLMGYKQPFQGVVRSIGWGIYVQDGSGSDATGLLPSISQTVDWVRLPQRFPVRIEPVRRSARSSEDRSNRIRGLDAGSRARPQVPLKKASFNRSGE